jgi:hypothetical protein
MPPRKKTTESNPTVTEGSNTMTDNMMDAIFTFAADLRDAEPPKPLPPGEYLATISKTEVATSKNTGKLYARITFVVPTEQYPADYDVEQEPDGVRLSHMLMIDNTPRTMYRWRTFLEDLDFFSNPENAGLRDVTSILERLHFLSARVTVAHEMYEGQEQARIKAVSAA